VCSIIAFPAASVVNVIWERQNKNYECLGFLWSNLMRAGHIELYCYHTIIFHTVPTTVRTVIISWDELHSLLMSDRISCCRPSYHSRFRLSIIHSFTAAKISLQRCKTDDYSWDANYLDKSEVTVGSSNGKLCGM